MDCVTLMPNFSWSCLRLPAVWTAAAPALPWWPMHVTLKQHLAKIRRKVSLWVTLESTHTAANYTSAAGTLPSLPFLTHTGRRMMKPPSKQQWFFFLFCLHVFATQQASGWLSRSFSRLDDGGATCSVTIMMQQHHSAGAWRQQEGKKKKKECDRCDT